MFAMIFAAGLGTRLKPFTDAHPKALFPLNGKPLLRWQIEMLRDAGIRDIVINVHHFAEQIVQYLSDNEHFGCNIRISDERGALLDTGGGVRKALGDLRAEGVALGDAPVLLCNADILSNISLPRFLGSVSRESLATLVVSARATQRYLLFDEGEQLRGWTNIATGEVRPEPLQSQQERAGMYRQLAFSGMQAVSPRIVPYLDEVAAARGEKFSLIDLYLHICEKHPEEVIRGYVPRDYHMMDVGKTAQVPEAEVFARKYLE